MTVGFPLSLVCMITRNRLVVMMIVFIGLDYLFFVP